MEAPVVLRVERSFYLEGGGAKAGAAKGIQGRTSCEEALEEPIYRGSDFHVFLLRFFILEIIDFFEEEE